MNRSNTVGTQDWLNGLTTKGITLKAYLVEEQEPCISAVAPSSFTVDREAWLLKNSIALESVCRGIKQATEGEVSDFGSFAAHANDEIE